MLSELRKNKYFQIGLTAFLVIAASILLGFVLVYFNKIVSFFEYIFILLSPFLLGFVFAYALNPLVKFNKKIVSKMIKKPNKTKLINRLSLLITCVLFIAVLIVLVSIIIPELLLSIEKLAINIPHYIEEIKNLLINKLSSEELRKSIIDNYEKIYSHLNTAVNTSIVPQIDSWLLVLSNGILGALKTIVNVIVGFAIGIYFLLDKDYFISGIKRVIYAIFSIKIANEIIENIKRVNEIFGDFFIGKLLDSLIIGLITFIFMAIFNYPYALLIGFIVGITNIIPYFGPWFGGIPSAFLIVVDNPTKGFIFIIFIIILQQIDGNFLGPKLCGSRIGLKSFWVLASILIFGKLFGVVGMLIGVPVFALLYKFIGEKITERLKKKNLPLDKEGRIIINNELKER